MKSYLAPVEHINLSTRAFKPNYIPQNVLHVLHKKDRKEYETCLKNINISEGLYIGMNKCVVRTTCIY